ncbi:hypothetical protein Tco_0735887 [Tanacetum coccineum]
MITVHRPHPLFNPLQLEATPTPTPITFEATTITPALPDFASIFRFNEIVTNLEKNLSEMKQVDQSSSQPQSSYEAAIALIEFELTKILIDKLEKNKDLFNTYGEVFSLKRGHDDRDKEKDPSAGSDRGSKRRKSSKDVESSKESMSKEKKSSSTSKDASQSQHKSSGKYVHTEEPSHTVEDSGVQQDQEFDMGHTEDQPNEEAAPKRDWYASNLTSSKDVYSRRRIIAVTRLTIEKKYDYGHLEEIEVRRDDQKLYTFKEGDFPRRRLQDIEDMLLLLVQQKLTNLTIDERYDFNVALRMFTRRIVIQKQVEYLQLGVESYQKKLNFNKPDSYRSDLRHRTAYTAYSDPQGIIYKDQYQRNRLMRTDELHKFSDGTLDDV